MDIGSASSYLPLQWAKEGHIVFAVDIRPYPFSHKNLTVLHDDISDPAMGQGLPALDVISCISTLEHIGVGYYGETMFSQGDVRALTNMHRLLKPGGALLLTVPFAAQFSQDDFQRIYDPATLKKLFARGWRLREERYHIPKTRKNWQIGTKQHALQQYPVYPESNNACFWFEKVGI